jgi:hypothetical protein
MLAILSYSLIIFHKKFTIYIHMLETPHAVIGAAIATAIPNPFIAIPLAFLSHFALDMTPHWNPHISTELKKYGEITKRSKRIIYADCALAVITSAFIASRALPDTGSAMTIGLSSFAGILPDVIEAPYFFLHWKTKFLENWLKFQKSIQNDVGVFWGMSTQVVTVIAALWWIFQ